MVFVKIWNLLNFCFKHNRQKKVHRKLVFLVYKNTDLKSKKNCIFPKALVKVHGFGQKFEIIFSAWFLSG